MTDAPQGTQSEPSAQPQTPVTGGAGAPLPKDVEEGKTFAILSYALGLIGLPFFIVPLIMRNNEFSLYHAKQCLILWLLGVAGGVVSGVLMVVCIGAVLAPIVGLACLVLDVIGLMNAVNGRQQPLPLIGKWGEEWFKGLKKA
jgi:uncharacterized membrane protein